MLIREPSGVPSIEYFFAPEPSVYARFTGPSIDPISPDLSKYNVSPPPMRELYDRAQREKANAPQPAAPPLSPPSSAKTAANAAPNATSAAVGAGGEKVADSSQAGGELIEQKPLTTFANPTMASPNGGQLTGLIKANQINMMVFFPPDKKPLEVRVEPTAMASDVVAAALAQHKRMATLAAHTPAPSSPTPDGESQAQRQDSAPPSKFQYDKPELHVLMMHDGDGQPDDMPVPGDTSMGNLNELEAVLIPKGSMASSSYMPATHEDIPEEEDEDLGGSVDSDFGTVPEVAAKTNTSSKTSGGSRGQPPPPHVESSSKEGRDRTFSYTPLAQMTPSKTSYGEEGGFGEDGGLTAEDLADFGVDIPPQMMSSSNAMSKRNTTSAGAELVTVTLPDGAACKVALDGPLEWRAADLIAHVALKGKHKIAVHSKEYELHVSWIDQERLHWPSTSVGPNEKLVDLQVRDFELKPRAFLDQPRIKMPGTRHQVASSTSTGNKSGLGSGGGGSTQHKSGHASGMSGKTPLSSSSGLSAPSSSSSTTNTALGGAGTAESSYELMYVVQTAELLEEWKVVKTNNWGRQQKRVIGIGKDTYDGEYKIYNTKRDDVGKSRISDQVKRATRFLKEVLSVRQDLPLRPRYFIITYRGEKDSDKPTAVTFEVPLNDNAPKGERTSIAFASSSSSADSLRASLSPEMRAEQEKFAAEQCLRIVAKMLFLLDLQRQRQRGGRSITTDGSGIGAGAAPTKAL